MATEQECEAIPAIRKEFRPKGPNHVMGNQCSIITFQLGVGMKI